MNSTPERRSTRQGLGVPARARVMVSHLRGSLRNARPAIEASWGTGCVVGAAVLLSGKAALFATGLAALANTGVLANLALLGGGLMFLREARRHARAARVVTSDDTAS